MLRKKSGSLEWLEFELLQDFPRLRHGVFLRHGGVSTGPFASSNVGGGSGDKPEKIAINREMIRRAIGCEKLISGKQVHGKRVVLAQEGEECDGFITKEKNIGLLIKHADCQAAIFYDPIKEVLACVHAGWRGNVADIYSETIEKMEQLFGVKPENLLVGISPSLGPCCAEFINYMTELPEEFWKFQSQHLHFDLWEISRRQLEAAGVLPHHIEIASICTKCNPDDYFSYRREKMSGRHGTVASMVDVNGEYPV